jgi:hypothetical protein
MTSSRVIMVKSEDAMVEMSWNISSVFIKQGSIVKTPIGESRFHFSGWTSDVMLVPLPLHLLLNWRKA